jgi:[protein-PII] uridylyltransferase
MASIAFMKPARILTTRDRSAEDRNVLAASEENLQSSGAWRLIEEEFLTTGRAAEVLSRLTAATDAIAVDAYRASIEAVFPRSSAMLAIGAYGRREIFPYSTADIIILLDQKPASELKRAVADVTRLLRGAGLRLNCTAIPIAECLGAHENLELAANLLDRRFLAGDGSLPARLDEKWPTFLARHGHAISRRLSQSAQVRHAQYQNTCRHLEPDVKETPGGLRDLRLIDWLAKLNPEHEPPSERLKQAGAFVSSARCFLHYHADRDSNVLDLEAQQALAHQAFTCARKPIEWMREYFQHARVIFTEARRALDASERSHSSLLKTFREYRSLLSNAEFTVSRDRLLLRSPAHLETDPELVVRLFAFVGRHGVPLAPETERRLEAVRPLFTTYCSQPRPLWAALKSILSSPHPAMAFRALENTGLLTALFREWANVEDLPVTDSEHRFTADEHTLASIECIAALRSATDPVRQRFLGLLSEIDNPALLLFAVLFHDMGRGADDPLLAAGERARAAMTRIQAPADDQATVEYLIEHQRDLADTMTDRNMDDPATCCLVARQVGTIERLKLLSLLTYAEIFVTHPDPMTSGCLEQLWRTYSATCRELTRELETDRIEQVPEDLPGNAEFIKGFPVRYLRAHTQNEIEGHLLLYERSRPTGAAVQLDHIEGGCRLTVVARDRLFLFASFAGAITSFGLDILKAEAFANRRGIVLDTFVVADSNRVLQLNPLEVERLSDLMQRVALGKTDVQRLMRNRLQAKPRKRVTPPQVQFDSETCETATLVGIVAEDRPGLLYSLATVFSSFGCNIDVVLTDTKDHRAIDLFCVAHDGRKLSIDFQESSRPGAPGSIGPETCVARKDAGW